MNKDEFVTKLRNLGLSKKDFAQKTKLSYMSVNNWNNDTRPVPLWVESWLEYYEKSKTLSEVIALLKPHLVE